MSYLVDKCFREEVEKFRWTLRKDGYYVRTVGKKAILLHRFVWELSGRRLPEAPITIDHVNRDPADNRIENLRAANQRLQNLNRAPRVRPNGLPRGVLSTRGRYSAQISIRGKSTHLGMFDTPADASAAYETELARQIESEESLTRAR